MSVRLLDVNVLISLLDSAHVHHLIAVKWFRSVAVKKGWATSPTTENGFIRIVSSVSYPNLRLSAGMAAASLAQLKAGFLGIHQFWPDEISLTDKSLFNLDGLTGSRQTTDTYLAGLAFRKGGRLATLDGAVALRSVVGAESGLVERIALR